MRQMWKVVMGNAPGLKAEIAKLHATEQAKLALREYELNLAHKTSAPRRPSSETPTMIPVPPTSNVVAASLSSPMPQSIPAKSAPVQPEGSLNERSVHRDGSISTSRSRSPDPSLAENSLVRRGGSSGVLGWMWSQLGQRPNLETTANLARRRSRGIAALEGPFTA